MLHVHGSLLCRTTSGWLVEAGRSLWGSLRHAPALRERAQPCFQLGALLALISCSFALDIATAEDQLPGEKALSGGLFSLPLLKVSSEESTQNERVTSIAFSPDGKTVLSGSHDKSIAVWDADAVLLDAKEGAHS